MIPFADASNLRREGEPLPAELNSPLSTLRLKERDVRDLLLRQVLGDPLRPDVLGRDRSASAEDAGPLATL